MSEESDRFEVTVAMTRGKSTNDRDKIKATISADTLEELDEKIDRMQERLEKLASDIRLIQPEKGRQLDDDQSTLGASK